MENKLKEMSTNEFIEKLKADANAELYGNVDEDDNEQVTSMENEQDKENALSDFSKFTRLIRRYKKVQTELRELVEINKDNEELQRYVKLLSKLDKLSEDLDSARKGYLYESASKVPNLKLENNDVKVSVTLPYEKKDFNLAKFEEDYKPDTDMYKKYMITKSVKGNLKYKIK